jgi:hypothetical protein
MAAGCGVVAGSAHRPGGDVPQAIPIPFVGVAHDRQVRAVAGAIQGPDPTNFAPESGSGILCCWSFPHARGAAKRAGMRGVSAAASATQNRRTLHEASEQGSRLEERRLRHGNAAAPWTRRCGGSLGRSHEIVAIRG